MQYNMVIRFFIACNCKVIMVENYRYMHGVKTVSRELTWYTYIHRYVWGKLHLVAMKFQLYNPSGAMIFLLLWPKGYAPYNLQFALESIWLLKHEDTNLARLLMHVMYIWFNFTSNVFTLNIIPHRTVIALYMRPCILHVSPDKLGTVNSGTCELESSFTLVPLLHSDGQQIHQ